MSQKIILNLDTDFQGDSQSGDEIWQAEAAEKLCKNLQSAAEKAARYRVRRKEKECYLDTEHNAFFISGGRGAGKTIFLKNAQHIWAKKEVSGVKLHSTPVVDPTLLMDHDDFTHVVIASLFNEVEAKLSKSSDSDKNSFYRTLKELSNALWSKDGSPNNLGIDRIHKYRSGIQIEPLFHNYVEQCIDILECQAIVMPIDDVDMGLDKAFDVLDVVRRLLSCPYIIPLVSGDYSLYKHISHLHFEEKTAPKTAAKTAQETGESIAKNLSESYLTKVLPGHLRLPLKQIHELLPDMQIYSDKKGSIRFETYEKAFIEHFYAWCNGEERSTDWPKPRSAREFFQLVSALPPENFNGDGVFEKNWRSFQAWAEQVQYGAAYTNAYASLQLQTMHNEPEKLDFSKLLAFSPVMQSQHSVGWYEKDFLAEQESALRQFPKTSGNEARKDIAENMPIIHSIFAYRPYVLRSMPPLEFYTEQMTIPQSHGTGDKTLRFLYTHYDYYGKQDNRTSKIFFSRAFELIATSLLVLSGEVMLESKDEWVRYLKELSMRAPFYCVHAVNPTKTMNDAPTESTSDVTAQDVNDETIKALATKMSKWLDTSQNLRSICQKKGMIPLISAVFNKVFSQLHLLRIEQIGGQPGKQEYLFYRTKRFEYMVLNAFASFMKSGRVVKANLAIDSRSEIVWDYDKFKTSGTFRSNVDEWMKENSDEDEWIKENGDEDADQKDLFKALIRHPVL